MKHAMRSFMLLTLMSFTMAGSAQKLSEVFNSESKLFYLGIDFTKARLIDDAGANEIDIRDKQFGGINDLIVNEPKKYDLAKAFHRSEIDHDLGPVAERNSRVNAADIKSTSSADFERLKEADIASIVKSFNYGKASGTGILFVMEGMSKSKKAASIWVVLIDIKSKKLLMTERVEAKVAGGFSWRNYWASSVRTLIDSIEKSKFKEWKKKYSTGSNVTHNNLRAASPGIAA
ncbi:MAG: hypothetical protein EOO02_09835 [Chitinophagaceae bacterium]|nr:MAG: hypothetical protein EOO02_09835 [Chitinophagaceae bacterium]